MSNFLVYLLLLTIINCTNGSSPTRVPSSFPSVKPSLSPSNRPTGNPSRPTFIPSSPLPSRIPSSAPSTRTPTALPSTRTPTIKPSTAKPSSTPSSSPSSVPSRSPNVVVVDCTSYCALTTPNVELSVGSGNYLPISFKLPMTFQLTFDYTVVGSPTQYLNSIINYNILNIVSNLNDASLLSVSIINSNLNSVFIYDGTNDINDAKLYGPRGLTSWGTFTINIGFNTATVTSTANPSWTGAFSEILTVAPDSSYSMYISTPYSPSAQGLIRNIAIQAV
eukprot:gene10352-13907_t